MNEALQRRDYNNIMMGKRLAHCQTNLYSLSSIER